MSLVKVPENREEEMIAEFIRTSALTFEGMDITSKKGKESLKSMEKLFRKTGYEGKDFVAYWFKGSVMNRLFRLTDDNAYDDDLTFVVVPGYYNPLVKISCGARWFDDIVASNSIAQNGIRFKHEPDFA